MRTVTAILFLACLASADISGAQESAQRPDNLYAQAVEDRLAGRHERAIAGFRRVLEIRPDDVDARLNLALSLTALDQLAEADSELARVLAVAPDYADARAARERVQRIQASRRSWRLDATVGSSRLSRGLPDWHEAAVTVARRDGATAVTAAIQYAERFERDDLYVEGRVDRQFQIGSVYGALGGTPEADFRPEVAVRVGGEFALGSAGSALTLDGGVSRYPVGTVNDIQPGLRFVLPGGALTTGARWINVWDESDTYRSGYSVSAIWAASRSLRLRLAYADAPESSEGTTVDVRAWSGGVDVDLNDRVTLRFNALEEDRRAYDRSELSLGVGLRF